MHPHPDIDVSYSFDEIFGEEGGSYWLDGLGDGECVGWQET